MALIYRCRGCGYKQEGRWYTACPGCGGLWACERPRNVLGPVSSLATAAGSSAAKTVYHPTGVAPFDKVIGGGLVDGCTILLGGTRGVGKTTLLLEVCNAIANAERPAFYASGEEKTERIQALADRIGCNNRHLYIKGNQTDIDEIQEVVKELKPFFTVYDSLQVITDPDVKGNEGSSAQGVAVANIITAYYQNHKRHPGSAVIVNHMTKLGDFAGSEEVQHLVDTIVMFDRKMVRDDDGEIKPETINLRQLISDKNRNGAEGEEAFFEMTAEGLVALKKSSVLRLVTD